MTIFPYSCYGSAEDSIGLLSPTIFNKILIVNSHNLPTACLNCWSPTIWLLFWSSSTNSAWTTTGSKLSVVCASPSASRLTVCSGWWGKWTWRGCMSMAKHPFITSRVWATRAMRILTKMKMKKEVGQSSIMICSLRSTNTKYYRQNQ